MAIDVSLFALLEKAKYFFILGLDTMFSAKSEMICPTAIL